MSSFNGKVKKVKSTTVPDRSAIENLRQEKKEKTAATRIQRAFRKWQKLRLMRMAKEAIQDSERIMLGRQRLDNLSNIDLNHRPRRDPLKESLDVENRHVWDRTQGEDFSAFERKNQENSNLLPAKSKEATFGQHSIDNNDADDDGEENKLAALNEMLKNKKFQIQKEDEEDFEMFLQKLNSKRQKDIGAFIQEQKTPSNAKNSKKDISKEEHDYDLTKITEKSKDAEEPSSSRMIEEASAFNL